MLKRLSLALGVFIAVLVACDLAVGVWWLADGAYQGRPLPPFGTWSSPQQVALLQHELSSPGVNVPGICNGFDPQLGWTNSPGEYRKQGVKYFNSIGARGQREYAPEPPPGVLRVACFGDSFTYGSDVKDGEDWPAQLEGRDEGLEAINMGVGGYGTDQALLRFRREGKQLGAHVVTIGLLLENIGRNVNRDRAVFYPQTTNVTVKPRFVLEDGELRLLPLPFETRRDAIQAAADGSIRELLSEGEFWSEPDPWPPGSSLARLVAGARAWNRRDTMRLWREPAGEPFRVTLAILEAFQREALEAGAQRAVVLVFPGKKDLAHFVHGGAPYWSALLAELERREIAYIDLAPDLALYEREEQTQAYKISHLTRRANGVVARRVERWLRSSEPAPGVPSAPGAR